MSDSAAGPSKCVVPLGFSFSALAAGIKASGRPDVALIACSPKTRAAALFTRNRVAAAPLQVAKVSLRAARGSVRAVLVNSGNANCATGQAGIQGCRQVCREAAILLDVRLEQVFPSSTGIIGVPFPAEKIARRLPDLIRCTHAGPEALRTFAGAIMTTDTRPKLAWKSIGVHGREVRVLGVAKGSGMIHPQLATMLVYILTDVNASPSQLRAVLKPACDQTFNCMSVDGDTSTNDTVLLLASGESGADLNETAITKAFRPALLEVCRSLAEQIVADGEGVQHVVRLIVEQARSKTEAVQVAKAVSHSLLVKTAWAGADPNWGRILAAIGYSGVPANPRRVNIFIGGQKVCRHGQASSFDEIQAHHHLSQPRCEVRIQLGRGGHSMEYLTTDLTADYVRINADYST
jgi:glutamate N-acetyltransferase/amino-acid N-acetyltransferase